MQMTRSKSSRQTLIQRILEKRRVASQEELRRILAKHGYTSNQATISRDVRELGLVKTKGAYALQKSLNITGGRGRPSTQNPPKLEHVYETVATGNLIVLRTGPGQASLSALQLDQFEHRDIVGTIAGDDTIFVATRSAAAARRLAKQLAGHTSR